MTSNNSQCTRTGLIISYSTSWPRRKRVAAGHDVAFLMRHDVQSELTRLKGGFMSAGRRINCLRYAVNILRIASFQNEFYLFLARYVPNVAKRSIWDQCKKKCISRTDRPTNDRPHIWENFKWPYLREGSSDPLHIWFHGGVFGVGGSNGAIPGLTKFNRYVGKNNARGVIRLVTI